MTIYCIACGVRHVTEENQVIVYDSSGLGLVTFAKECQEKADKLTVEGLANRGYTNGDIANRIVEGIKEKFGPMKKKHIKKGGE